MEARWTRTGRGGNSSRAAYPVGWLIFFAVALCSRSFAAASDPASPGSATALATVFIDQLIEQAWTNAGVKPAKPATDDEFLRRAYLDLLGRIPNVHEARAFLTTREPDKRGKLVENLLEHPDYANN